MHNCDILVVGAGPAGMAAATVAAAANLRSVLLDEQSAAGGQIYRSMEKAAGPRGHILGPDYLAGRDLVTALRDSGVRHEKQATVWNIDADGTVAWSRDGQGYLIKAKRLILATGALERPVPLPGWTLPGVMTAGAAQILLKQSGVVPERAVVAGCGPLVYLIAQQLVRAGVPPLALLETQTRVDMLRAARFFPGALRGWRYLTKGAGMLSEIRGARVPRHTQCTEIHIEGTERASGISFVSGGQRRRIDCDTVLLHQGVVPNTQATRALGIDHVWDAAQRCFRPSLDAWGRTSLPTIYVAGDGGGIGGAKAAAVTGELTALHAARELGALPAADVRARALVLRRKLDTELAVRPFLAAMYPPAPEVLRPAGNTIVCRCEEVTAGDIRRYARLGCLGPNQTKAFSRAGMGPCQGRYCGLTVTELLAEANGLGHDDVGSYHIRMPLKPITLGELAMIGSGENEDPARCH